MAAPEEWPISAASQDRGVKPARPAGRQRLATVRSDFFLDPADRLTEQERALMATMLADLLGWIAVELRAKLPKGWNAANDEGGQQLIRQLQSASLLDQTELISVLLRRADEERVANALRARSSARPAFLQAMIGDSAKTVSASAMALILARGRRHDRLGQPRIDFDDLSPVLAGEVAASMAAAIRARLAATIPAEDADRYLGSALAELLQRHDPAKSVQVATQSLARALSDSGKLDEDLMAAAAEEGDLAFLSEGLSVQADIPGAVGWDYLIDGHGGGFSCLLRMAGATRSLAARLLAALAELIGIADPAGELARFDAIEESAAERSRQWLRLDSRYRTALEALGKADGQRAV